MKLILKHLGVSKQFPSVIVSVHPFWIDAKEGGRDAADQLGVTFEYTQDLQSLILPLRLQHLSRLWLQSLLG